MFKEVLKSALKLKTIWNLWNQIDILNSDQIQMNVTEYEIHCLTLLSPFALVLTLKQMCLVPHITHQAINATISGGALLMQKPYKPVNVSHNK